ncbi:MAG: winged helix-turn-helix transcriptional regulator, partial [Armatimonadetes bacterium]|nr:winged helix-turn-helix transcriptional regulator [Armatimonadota bacterium]
MALRRAIAVIKPQDETCEVQHVDEAKVRKVLRVAGPDGRFEGVARMFQVLADPTRAKLLFALSREELCVCDLAAIVDRSRPAVSHQLRLLRDLKLVQHRRQGKIVYYRLADEHVRHLVEEGLEHA